MPFFSQVLVFRLRSGKAIVDLRYPLAEDDVSISETTLGEFCFPETADGLNALRKRLRGGKNAAPTSEMFEFTLTDKDSARRFCYCRRRLVNDALNTSHLPEFEAIVVLATESSFSLYAQLLELIEAALPDPSTLVADSTPSSASALVELARDLQARKAAALAWLGELYASPLPAPGESIAVRVDERQAAVVNDDDDNDINNGDNDDAFDEPPSDDNGGDALSGVADARRATIRLTRPPDDETHIDYASYRRLFEQYI